MKKCAFLPIAALLMMPLATPSAAVAPAAPRINGPSVYGVRPGSPLLYSIPATGDRPMQFSVTDLPRGLALDTATGRVTGTLKRRGEYTVVLQARNAIGTAEKAFRIVVGDRIALTPPMGWNSWNCWAGAVDQEKVLRSARALVASGLANHGWSTINIDDAWQGVRGGPLKAIQPNRKFPDMKGLCDTLHGMGLKAGIYSTPWTTSYAGYCGGSSDDPSGAWTKGSRILGKYPFALNDARQWAEWGMDYLKYDWNPIDEQHVVEMSKALRQSGRDIVFSLSNSAALTNAAVWARWSECWRTTGDIWDSWDQGKERNQHSVSGIGFAQDRWAPYAGPGHWNDPDMLVVGQVGWGSKVHPTRLTPDEQRSHISLWCLLSAPLLIGCDLEQLDPLTLELLGNDEVLALDQDALGQQAVRVAASGPIDVYSKPLEDGSVALGFFNRDSTAQTLYFNKLGELGFTAPLRVRDLWRQQDLSAIDDVRRQGLTMAIPSHGVQLYKISPK